VAKTRRGKPPADVADGARASDEDVFAREMFDVVRLQPDARGRLARRSPKDGGEVNARAAAIVPPAAETASQEDGALDAFAVPGVDRREIRKLKRGDYPPGRHTDLHGLSGDDACARVARFLENSRHGGHRCVCIVHGRGLHSAGRAPVLRTRVREYLRSHRVVLAYADAPAADGGSGAVYVLLRK
jgi:DNA-nicking Smr family endonuclease